MEDFKEKYEQALGWMQSLYNGLHGKTKEEAEHFFPELKESEDERIRKGIIEYLEQSQFGEKHYCIDDDIVRRYIAWLEKQGEQKPTDKPERKFKVGDWITNGEYTWKVTDIKPLIRLHPAITKWRCDR